MENGKWENGRPWDVRKINRAGVAVHVLRIRMRKCGGYEFAAENVRPSPKKKMFEPELCHLTVSEFAQFIIFVFCRGVLLFFVFFCHHPVVLGFCFAFLHLLNMLNY